MQGSPETEGQLLPAWVLVVADYARHVQLSSQRRTAASYLDTLQRLASAGVDPLQASRVDLERFLSRSGRGCWGDRPGGLPASTKDAELSALRRFYQWARGRGSASMN